MCGEIPNTGDGISGHGSTDRLPESGLPELAYDVGGGNPQYAAPQILTLLEYNYESLPRNR
jgi:hypothetical protein